MLLNTSIETSANTKNCILTKWLLDNGADVKLLTEQSMRLVGDYAIDELTKILDNAT